MIHVQKNLKQNKNKIFCVQYRIIQTIGKVGVVAYCIVGVLIIIKNGWSLSFSLSSRRIVHDERPLRRRRIYSS
jgi:hypothetical protein